jgi:uncharacterized protein YcaQ
VGRTPVRAQRNISRASARRIAVAAQGLADPRPTGRVTQAHLKKVLDRIGLIQIDSVNVLVRSQELPLFARLGDHPRSLIPDATARGDLFEYWAHVASHVPSAHHRLWRWKMEHNRTGPPWPEVTRALEKNPRLLTDILDRVRDGGPIVAGEVRTRTGPKGTWWDWDEGKHALEHLFWTGELAARRRPNDFARVYDLPERFIPAQHLDGPTPSSHDARKELLVLAARSLGVATHADLADYYRLNVPQSRPLMTELVDEGRLELAHVEGWTQQAYLYPEARIPRRVEGRALLSPFDSLVWNRDRNLRLWDFHYRIEIYTPAPKRIYGYYVLPFLLGEHLVARVDLKADRARRTLLVRGVFAELGVPTNEVVDALADELSLMARWLQLDTIEVGDRGDLAAALRRATPSP